MNCSAILSESRPSGSRCEVTHLDGEPFVTIRNVDTLPPFLVSVVSDGEGWIFAGSNAAFTAGRLSPERSLFPYRSADKILAARNGGNLYAGILATPATGGETMLWEPFADGQNANSRRHLHKHVTGGMLVFEESCGGLGFEWHIGFSERHGLVKKAMLRNDSTQAFDLRCLEGWENLLPPGIPDGLFDRMSYLALAYMRHELTPEGLALYSLNVGISDRAEPCESLRFAAAWSDGPLPLETLLTSRQVHAFRTGRRIETEHEMRGGTGSHLELREMRLVPGETVEWWSATDTWLDHSGLSVLRAAMHAARASGHTLKNGFRKTPDGLRRIIGEVDGWQVSGDPAIGPHHASNALFNAMRGGLPAAGNLVPDGDFAAFLAGRNPALAAAHRPWLDRLPDGLEVGALRVLAEKSGDPDLERVAGEYLPLTFGRRHGDPSRPWNRFAIRVKNAAGKAELNYQGNWRDIFQNWEALAVSFPAHLPAMVATFLNASTADGFNPYRIERAGVDWEVPDPSDPWSHIGYWGDHQIVYLTRLLELHERYFPGRLSARLDREVYVSTDVPYRIRKLSDLLSDPRSSIQFDEDRHRAISERVAAKGNDAKLLLDSSGGIARATLAEKLLVPVLVKIANLVPGGGVWMNTQRPEWNDANNALAGWGLSVVTAAHLHRHLLFLIPLFGGSAPRTLTARTALFLRKMTALCVNVGWLGARDERERFQFLLAAGKAAEVHREAVYSGEGGEGEPVDSSEIRSFLNAALDVVRETLSASRIENGLFHSYNLLEIAGGEVRVNRLDLMLEGQAAVLGSSVLEPAEAVRLAESLRASALYRPDQNSYILYPNRNCEPIMERNRIADPGRAPILAELFAAGVTDIAAPDAEGEWHFHAGLTNAAALSARLDALAADPCLEASVRRDRQAVLGLWEEVFRHATFTGRSGGMFGFEGLGCIYWHMVAKLLLAIGETHRAASETRAEPEVLRKLAAAYHDVRSGLGFMKSPAEFGAFPTDPYSHTPAHAGAQQPGMTGQVKEEILARFLELGVEVRNGSLRFAPRLLKPGEFLPDGGCFSYFDVDGHEPKLDLPAESLGFTICQVPVVFVLADKESIRVDRTDGRAEHLEGHDLPAEISRGIFSRTGTVSCLTVYFPAYRLSS